MSPEVNRSRKVILLEYALIISSAIILLYVGLLSRNESPLLNRQLIPNGIVTEQGLFVEPVTVGNKKEYWFSPKPKKSNWILVGKIPLGNNSFYPIYYTTSGHQVLRQNKVTGLFTAHAWVDSVSLFFIVDTGATVTMIGEGNVLNKLGSQCTNKSKTSSVDKTYWVCSTKVKEVNLDGFLSRQVSKSNYASPNDYNFPSNWQEQPAAQSINLFGMNMISGFNFVIKNNYMHIQPNTSGRFTAAPAIAALSETNAIIKK